MHLRDAGFTVWLTTCYEMNAGSCQSILIHKMHEEKDYGVLVNIFYQVYFFLCRTIAWITSRTRYGHLLARFSYLPFGRRLQGDGHQEYVVCSYCLLLHMICQNMIPAFTRNRSLFALCISVSNVWHMTLYYVLMYITSICILIYMSIITLLVGLYINV